MQTISRRTFTRIGLSVAGAWASGWAPRLTAAELVGGDRRLLGTISPRTSAAISASPLGVGFETLDRRMFDPQRCYEPLAALGVKWARVQTGWARCETERGRYDFAWLDEIVDRLRAIGVQPWFNVGYGNRLYTPEAPDESAVGWAPIVGDEPRQGWGRFVSALAEHFRGRVQHWEIWNEPNIAHFWQPAKPSPIGYMDLVKLTAPAIRGPIPDAVLIGGAFSGMPTAFLSSCLELGLADKVDRISYHPYVLIPETGYAATMAAWRKLLDGKPSLALWQGECGCPSSEGGVGALSQYRWNDLRQAKWLLRRTLLDLGLGIELVSYFHLVDLVRYTWTGRTEGDAQARTNYRADFGLLRGDDYTPKPSYHAYQRLCALFDAETRPADLPISFAGEFAGEPAISADKICRATFLRGDKPVYAYWWPSDVQQEFPVRSVDVTLPRRPGASLPTPVLVDLLDGNVYGLPSEADARTRRFLKLPLADYPLLVTDAAVAVGASSSLVPAPAPR